MSTFSQFLSINTTFCLWSGFVDLLGLCGLAQLGLESIAAHARAGLAHTLRLAMSLSLSRAALRSVVPMLTRTSGVLSAPLHRCTHDHAHIHIRGMSGASSGTHVPPPHRSASRDHTKEPKVVMVNNPMFDLTGKTAVVTGGGRDIGAACAVR